MKVRSEPWLLPLLNVWSLKIKQRPQGVTEPGRDVFFHALQTYFTPQNWLNNIQFDEHISKNGGWNQRSPTSFISASNDSCWKISCLFGDNFRVWASSSGKSNWNAIRWESPGNPAKEGKGPALTHPLKAMEFSCQIWNFHELSFKCSSWVRNQKNWGMVVYSVTPVFFCKRIWSEPLGTFLKMRTSVKVC